MDEQTATDLATKVRDALGLSDDFAGDNAREAIIAALALLPRLSRSS